MTTPGRRPLRAAARFGSPPGRPARSILSAMAISLAVSLAVSSLWLSPPARADTFRIEIDYMVGAHSHMPQPAEIAAVQQMFACHGHTLIVDVSDAIPHYDVLKLDPNDNQNFFDYDGVPNSFKAIKDQYYNHAGVPGWHYCIFGHQYETVDLLGNYFVTTSSGLGETPGDDFVVTLGTFANSIGTPFDRAATLAHEFGHNLGLTHCNESTCSVIGPYGPNHASIMSYAYQLRGVRTAMLCDGLIPPQAAYLFKDLDYSNGTMCSLNETYLDETMGTTMRQVDWNCDGYLNLSVVQDLSSDQYLGGPDPGWCGNYGSQQTIHDEDEWSSIVDVAAQKTADQLKRLPMTSCITAEEATRYAQKWSCPTPVLASEACVAGRAMYVVAGARGFPTGNCTAPYGSVQSAVSAAPSTSSLFLSPATYSVTAGGSYVLNKPLKFFAVKGARMQ